MTLTIGSVNTMASIPKEIIEELRWKQQLIRNSIDDVLKRKDLKDKQPFADDKENQYSSHQEDRDLISNIYAPRQTRASPSSLAPRDTKIRLEGSYQLTELPRSTRKTSPLDKNMEEDIALRGSIHAPRRLRDAYFRYRAKHDMDSSEVAGSPEDTDDKKDGEGKLVPASSANLSTLNKAHASAGGDYFASVADSTRASTYKGSKGTNPEATSFTPGAQGHRGVRSPEDFMAHFRAMQAAKAEKNTDKPPSPRRILFGNVPEWAKFNDMMCLIHGGAVETMYSEGPRQMSVDFVDTDACQQYYDLYSGGIRIGDDIMTVELGEPANVNQVVKKMSDEGKSRVVYIDMEEEKTFAEVHEICAKFDLDHLMYHVEPTKAGRAYFFLTSLTQGDELHRLLNTERDWAGSNPQFMKDPCAIAQTFHANTILGSDILEAQVNVDVLY